MTVLGFPQENIVEEGKWWIRIFQVEGLVFLKINKSIGVFQRPFSDPG